MASDILLKIDDIKGESQDAKHSGAIEVSSWQFGMTQSGSAHRGTGAGSGKVEVSNLSITKVLDCSSPTLMKYCCSGKHFKQATLLLRKAAGEQALEYARVVMTDGLIASVSVHGANGNGQTAETVTFNFAAFSCEYTPQTASGAGAGTIPMKWSIAKNAES